MLVLESQLEKWEEASRRLLKQLQDIETELTSLRTLLKQILPVVEAIADAKQYLDGIAFGTGSILDVKTGTKTKTQALLSELRKAAGVEP